MSFEFSFELNDHILFKNTYGYTKYIGNQLNNMIIALTKIIKAYSYVHKMEEATHPTTSRASKLHMPCGDFNMKEENESTQRMD